MAAEMRQTEVAGYHKDEWNLQKEQALRRKRIREIIEVKTKPEYLYGH